MLEDLDRAEGPAARTRRASVLLGLVGGVVLFWWLANREAGFAAQDVGLGRNTLPTVAELEGRQISGPFEDLEVVRATFRELRAEGRRIVLWIGASQLYAINQPEPGDQLAVWYAARRAAGRDPNLAYVMCANPNANPNELLCTYLLFRQEGLVPDALVLGFTYDDLGETGIRNLVLDALRPLDEEERRIGGEAARNVVQALAEREQAPPPSAPVERNAVAGTPQERLEDWLVAGLEEVWPAYAHRGSLRSSAIAAWKIPFTGLVYRVFSRPKKVVPPHVQAWNEPALEALRAFARADGVPLFVYKAPHRPAPDAQFYHPRRQYDAYHAELERRLAAEGVPYLDLETLVPTEYWGTTNDGSPDVFHYRDEGHRLLGEAVDAWLEEQGF